MQNNIISTNELIDKSIKTFIYALGGLGEVGKNTYCVEHGNNIIIIDAGVKFPEADFPGVDYVIPDYTYLIKNRAKIKALIITHGHEDHIGGIPFLLQSVDIPVIYASKLSSGLIKGKLVENKLKDVTNIVEIDSNTEINIGPLNITCISMTHSIPDSFGIAIKTPNGTIVTTGDFKIDLTPIGPDIDFPKIAKLSEKGVTLLMSDSTNAEVEGMTKSEKVVAKSLNNIFKDATGRIIIATFASNVHRIQQIIESGIKYKRKILVFGRSMENAISTGRKLGYIKCPDKSIVDMEKENISTYKNLNEILILCTGSQGEPMAALSRIANNTHKVIKIIPGDMVIFSSNPIPGNVAPVNNIVNKLAKAGADVVLNNALNSIHTSGHASKEELKLMLKLFRPKFFMPVHGEYRMLKIHAGLATSMGVVNKEDAFILSNGDTLVMSKGVVTQGKRIEAGSKYIDGKDINGIENAVLIDRKNLSNDGLISVVVVISSKTNQLLRSPSLVSRGFIYLKERGEMLVEAEKLVYANLQRLMVTKSTFSDIKRVIKETVGKFVYEKTNRSPIIIPVILNKRES